MSLWLIPTDAPGLSTAPLDKIGQQIIPFVDVFFDEVRLTEDMRLGKEGEGFLLLMKNFEIERCLVAAQSLGLAQACMDDAAAYANERYAFGKPIGWNPMIQDMLAEMETILENSRNMLYKTLWQLDQENRCAPRRPCSSATPRWAARKWPTWRWRYSRRWATPRPPASAASGPTCAATSWPAAPWRS